MNHRLQCQTKLMEQCQKVEQNWTAGETLISVFL